MIKRAKYSITKFQNIFLTNLRYRSGFSWNVPTYMENKFNQNRSNLFYLSKFVETIFGKILIKDHMILNYDASYFRQTS